MIHQEPISFPDLSVAENLVIGRTGGGPLSRVRWTDLAQKARRAMELLNVPIDVTALMRGLSIADQQMVEIARALASDSRLIVMDEPTAALTPKEVETLFNIVRRLRDEGRTIVFISHRLEEVRAICDRLTIFRDGDKIETAPAKGLTDAEIIRRMIGRPISDYLHGAASKVGEVALSVRRLTLPGRFEDISFDVRKGEIVGLGGLVGAGRTDVARAIFGVVPATSGDIVVDGRPAKIKQPSDAIGLGIAFVPEDRAAAGIFRSLSVESNVTAAVPRQIAPGGIIRRSAEKLLAMQSITKLRIRLASLRQPIGELSGGNQQKSILARWLLADPRILILDEPTRGIDVGVKAEFYETIGELAAGGRAVLLISSELPELLALSDRVLVMSEGRLTADIPRAEASQEAIMNAAVPRAGRRYQAGSRSVKSLARLFRAREAGIAVMLVLFSICVGLIEPRFLTVETLRIVLLAVPLIMVAAMGEMMVLVARHVDLSIGSILGFSAIAAGMIFRDRPDLPLFVGFAVAIVSGALLGFFNGLIVTIFELPAIIVTLGTLSLYRGLLVHPFRGAADRSQQYSRALDSDGADFADRYSMDRHHRICRRSRDLSLSHLQSGWPRDLRHRIQPGRCALARHSRHASHNSGLYAVGRACRPCGHHLRRSLRLRESGHHRRRL